jgi:acetamidase/formamidase
MSKRGKLITDVPLPHGVAEPIKPDATLRSTADTVLWGYIAANLPPALTIKSGQIVQIEALSHQGLTTNQDPVKFFDSYGIRSEDVLPDAIALYSQVKRPKGASVHILTGPIYVEGAEPGDTLEVRVLDITFRVPYGINNTGPEADPCRSGATGCSLLR